MLMRFLVAYYCNIIYIIFCDISISFLQKLYRYLNIYLNIAFLAFIVIIYLRWKWFLKFFAEDSWFLDFSVIITKLHRTKFDAANKKALFLFNHNDLMAYQRPAITIQFLNTRTCVPISIVMLYSKCCRLPRILWERVFFVMTNYSTHNYLFH